MRRDRIPMSLLACQVTRRFNTAPPRPGLHRRHPGNAHGLRRQRPDMHAARVRARHRLPRSGLWARAHRLPATCRPEARPGSTRPRPATARSSSRQPAQAGRCRPPHLRSRDIPGWHLPIVCPSQGDVPEPWRPRRRTSWCS